MKNKTAVQEVFSELEKLHPQLFNVYTQEGRDFLNYFHKFLEIEKQQMKYFIQIGYYAHSQGQEKNEDLYNYWIENFNKKEND